MTEPLCSACGRPSYALVDSKCADCFSRAPVPAVSRDETAPVVGAGREFESELEYESEWESSGLALQEPSGDASNDADMATARQVLGAALRGAQRAESEDSVLGAAEHGRGGAAPEAISESSEPPTAAGGQLTRVGKSAATATTDTITASDMLQKINAGLRAYADGEDVELPAKSRRGLREDAINSEIAVANFAVLLNRVMLGISLRMPMILAGPFVAYWMKEPRIAEYCGLRRPISKTTASDCVKTLRKDGVLAKVDETKTWRGRPAYLYELAPVEVVGRGGEQPHAALVDDGLVLGAELEGAVPVRVAARNGAAAGGGGVHA